ncbi:MAG: hypothetical protein P4L77_13160 [Sulfuriferula sp.]|nr:hypothetical protein [Sulfuriferula sp.]
MEKTKGMLYPALVVSGISVTAFSLLGMLTMTGWVPYAGLHERAAIQQEMQKDDTADAGVEMPAVDQTVAAFAADKWQCQACGVVASIRLADSTVNQAGPNAVSGSRLGTVSGNIGSAMSLVYIAGDTHAANMKNAGHAVRYVVRVNMDGGGYRTFYLDHRPVYRVGERIRLDHGSPITMS